MNNEEYKQQVYKKWIERGRPWFNVDPSDIDTYGSDNVRIIQ